MSKSICNAFGKLSSLGLCDCVGWVGRFDMDERILGGETLGGFCKFRTRFDSEIVSTYRTRRSAHLEQGYCNVAGRNRP